MLDYFALHTSTQPGLYGDCLLIFEFLAISSQSFAEFNTHWPYMWHFQMQMLEVHINELLEFTKIKFQNVFSFY